MRPSIRTGICLLSLMVCAACDSDPRRGGAGETCGSADDCRDGLACVATVCVSEADGGSEPETSLLPSGASCAARRDCEAGLLCIDNACASAMTGTSPGEARLGGTGESCQAKNDCASELSCIANMCRKLELSLSRTPKSCFRVECSSKADCCGTFAPNANCETYRRNCEMDPIFCNTYRSLCECNRDCEEEQCVMAAAGCQTSAECTSAQTPYCLEGKCRQCDQDSTCAGQGTKCVEGVCTAACAIDENCPPLHGCKDSVCVETGCKSDRECAFMQKNPLAVCREGDCQVPCDTDSDCMGQQGADGFQICDEGQCEFVGCESDAECRALLELDSQPGTTHAVCR